MADNFDDGYGDDGGDDNLEDIDNTIQLDDELLEPEELGDVEKNLDNIVDEEGGDELVEDEEVEEEVVEEEHLEEKKCMYKYVDEDDENKENKEDEDLEEDEEEGVEDEEEEKKKKIIQSKERISKPMLTKYERVRLLSTRAKQLSLGAKPMIKNSKDLTALQIAELEIKNNVIPLVILRPMPDGKKEKWYIKELAHD